MVPPSRMVPPSNEDALPQPATRWRLRMDIAFLCDSRTPFSTSASNFLMDKLWNFRHRRPPFGRFGIPDKEAPSA